jgi:regulator of cell morphogenesis and NO signaling
MSKYKHISIGRIVADNLAAAVIFEKRGMDFCCHGEQTLEEACSKHGFELDELISELEALERPSNSEQLELSDMNIAELAEFIVQTHHTFTKKVLSAIPDRLDTVIRVHGRCHPELVELQTEFTPFSEKLTIHLQKEEEILFPGLEKMVQAQQNASFNPDDNFSGTVFRMIGEMEQEHEVAGEILDGIHTLTNGFKVPEDACNTYRLLYSELAALEQDLHRHIALENYMLFPKAIELERTLSIKR